MKLICVRLLVSDFAASLKFWRDVVELPVSYSDESMGYAHFKLGETGIELMSRDEFVNSIGEVPATNSPAERQVVLNVQVDDVDATYARLVERGATSVFAPQDRPAWGARTAHLSDPDGHLLEIYTSLSENNIPTA
ncbi:extradiol dioxygenase [Dictyobacter vulcani]|uniref:Extradiol dioxygenase n=1 Tax=Dictyobacter vulcani TaxID=2607529 RepID=A0A5J4KBI2_9CHLR|nr:VOC family protein [Dictyobacter vulcani]GER85974.1 extradiol dioxygenase [Dictyobacter vulcani]